MKIIIVVSEFPKVTETFAYRNAIEYARLGHDVQIFHIKRFRTREIVHGFMQEIVDSAFTIGFVSPAALGALIMEAVTAPRRLGGLLARIFVAHRSEPKRGFEVLTYVPKAIALGRWCRSAGVDHIHAEFAGHPATTAMIAAQVSGIPFSFSAHANDIVVSQALLVEKAQQAAFVRSISLYNIAFLRNLPGFPAEKLHLVRCGVTGDTLQAESSPTLPERPFQILYVGSLIKKKGVRYLIDALARLPADLDWEARIVGGGNCEAELAEQTRTLGLEDRVRFEGPQPAEVVTRAFGAAHVAVVPSIIADRGRIEGIPVVVMEALAHGVPVIASALSGIPELVEDGVSGRLVPPGDPVAIAKALQEIAADWPVAAELARRGREKVAAEYVVEDNARKLVALMEKIV